MGYCWSRFGWGGMGGLGALGPLVHVVLTVALLAALVALAIWLARWLGRQARAPEAGSDPLEIARRRLAAGEITAAQYEEIRQHLGR